MPSTPFEEYVEDYLAENVGIESYADEDMPDPRGPALAEALLAGAKAEGYSEQELAGWKEKLPGIISRRFERNTDAEVRRLANKDD